MKSSYITIKNNNLDIGIYGFTEVFFSLPSTIRIKDQNFTFISVESLGVSSNKSVQKDVGNTLARGVLGGVLLGPIGAIGGLMVGNNKVTGTDEYTYKVNLAGDKFFIYSSSTPDINFYSLTPAKAIQINEPIESTSNKKIKANSSIVRLVESMGGVEKLVKKCIVEQLHHNDNYFERHNEHLNLNEADITNELSFADDLHGDDLDAIEILMSLEEYLECKIPDEEGVEETLTTVQSFIDYVNTFVYGTTKPQQMQKTEPPQTKVMSILDEVKKLAELRSSGVLNEEEFLDLKTKLLKRVH